MVSGAAILQRVCPKLPIPPISSARPMRSLAVDPGEAFHESERNDAGLSYCYFDLVGRVNVLVRFCMDSPFIVIW